MNKRQIVSGFLVLPILFLGACAPQAAPAPAAAPAAQVPAAAPAAAVPAAPAKLAWEIEWEKAVRAAKTEGTVVIYTSGIGGTALQQGFKAAHGIGAEFVSGPSATLNEKVLRERRAGLYLVDLSMLGTSSAINVFGPAGILYPLPDLLILPEVTDLKMWRGGELLWIDSARTTTLAFVSFVMSHILLNPNLVKPEEIKSWRDLLNPKWKKQIIIGDVTLPTGPPLVWAHMTAKIMGWDYMRELAKQEPVIVEDARMLVEWVARGKYPVALGIRPEVVYDFWKLGAPIETVVAAEGAFTNAGSGTIALFKNAPHPNAAQVFVNWLLTKEGQTVYAQTTGYPSLRTDVPTKGLYPALILDPKLKYLRADTEESILERPQSSKIAREIFLPLKR